MSYLLQPTPRAAPASVPTIDEEALRDTGLRFASERMTVTTGITALRDPVTNINYPAVAGEAIGFNRVRGDFTVISGYISDGSVHSARRGLNLGEVPWRGASKATIASVVRWTAVSPVSEVTQAIIASRGPAASYLFFGLASVPSDGHLSLVARHSLDSEASVRAVLPMTDDVWRGVIGEIDYEGGTVTLRDVISGEISVGEADPAVWAGPAGNPAIVEEYAFARNNAANQAFYGEATDVLFWAGGRTDQQIRHVEAMLKSRLIGLGAL
jgi:hypothetical protein